MGGFFSHYKFLDAEKMTWMRHTVEYDQLVRDTSLACLDKCFPLASVVTLCFQENTFGGVAYKHYFVHNAATASFLEFGAAALDIYQARVNINQQPRGAVLEPGVGPFVVDEAMRTRIRHVLGMSSYSLVLRNCEHVARYVLQRQWFSDQMQAQRGALLEAFKGQFVGRTQRMINSFPSSLQPACIEVKEEPYPFLRHSKEFPPFNAQNIVYFLDNHDTYNIVLFGPTGSGKSRIINVLFNQELVVSEQALSSVTSDIQFIKGRGMVYNDRTFRREHRDLVIADTVGLCDTRLSRDQLLRLLKSRINSNVRHIDKVIIAFSATRLPDAFRESIRDIMQWLDYDTNYRRFIFVMTHCDSTSPQQQANLEQEARVLLGLNKQMPWKRLENNKWVTDQRRHEVLTVGFPAVTTITEVLGVPAEKLPTDNPAVQRITQRYEQLQFPLTAWIDGPRIDVRSQRWCNLL